VRYRLGIRWWLGAAFALIAAVTAVAVALVFSQSSRDAFRDRAEDVAVGRAVSAAIELARMDRAQPLDAGVSRIADRHSIAIFVFDHSGRLLTGPRSRGVAFARIADGAEALSVALRDRRFVATNEDVEATVIGLPVRSGERRALVVYASHPDLAAGLGILHREVVGATLWAILLGGVIGLVLATLISLRLRRIAATAAAIESGEFDQPLHARFPDEVGELAATIERMRRRLRASFTRLETERDRLEALLERLNEGVLLVRRDLRIVVANAEAGRMLGLEPAEGNELPDPWPTPSLRGLASSLFDARQELTEVRVAVDEDTVYLVVGVPPTADGDDAVLVLTDVSERERRERAEREFVTNAAHELRTPLTTITGAVEALQSGAKEIPEQRDRFLAHIERDSKRLVRLARALLVLARAQTAEEAPRLETVELRPLLDDVAASLVPAAGVVVKISCPSGLAVLTQPELAEQALANVATNAAKNTAAGTIELCAWEEPGSVVIEVRDTGSGMSSSATRRIFDRFYRGDARDGDGFGLGMAIVNESVRALGGTVRVESVAEIGTTVRITLPSAATRAA
jgi:two-component system phosphate regulon sensor histidine kinase PhoR